MKARPLLMTPENGQKCHDGTKTMTRRIVKLPLRCPAHDVIINSIEGDSYDLRANCPYGQVGERIWLREACWIRGRWVRNGKAKTGRQKYRFQQSGTKLVCFERPEDGIVGKKDSPTWGWVRRPGLFMPRWACRTLVEIVSLRVERLQEITEEDALAEIGELQTVTQEWIDDCPEGSKAHELATLMLGMQLRAALSFMNLWISINGAGSWDANPWVWVIGFKKVMT